MTHIWVGLSICHLQFYPFKMQKLSSQRKDNVPIRCFPDNTLGQQSGIALPSALCWETRPTVLNRSFSRFKQTKSCLHMPALFSSPSRDATKLSLLGEDQELPNPYPQYSVSIERPDCPCCLVLLYLWTGCTILMITQAKKLIKTKGLSLKTAWPQWNSN